MSSDTEAHCGGGRLKQGNRKQNLCVLSNSARVCTVGRKELRKTKLQTLSVYINSGHTHDGRPPAGPRGQRFTQGKSRKGIWSELSRGRDPAQAPLSKPLALTQGRMEGSIFLAKQRCCPIPSKPARLGIVCGAVSVLLPCRKAPVSQLRSCLKGSRAGSPWLLLTQSRCSAQSSLTSDEEVTSTMSTRPWGPARNQHGIGSSL